MKIVIIGAGNVGTALAVLLQRAGHQIVGLTCRTPASAAAAAAHVQAPYGTDPLQFTPHADLVLSPHLIVSLVTFVHKLQKQKDLNRVR